MKTTMIRAALACAALAMSGTAAIASEDPIPGIDIIVRSHPVGKAIMAHTDAGGRARLERLAPGDYTVTIPGQGLVAAMDRIAARVPKKAGPALPSGGAGVAVGDLNADGRLDRASSRGPGVHIILDLGRAGRISKIAPCCRRDQAREGVTIAFTIPNRGGARPGQRVPTATLTVNAISDQASAGNLSSY
jgi:hypothetical protein